MGIAASAPPDACVSSSPPSWKGMSMLFRRRRAVVPELSMSSHASHSSSQKSDTLPSTSTEHFTHILQNEVVHDFRLFHPDHHRGQDDIILCMTPFDAHVLMAHEHRLGQVSIFGAHGCALGATTGTASAPATPHHHADTELTRRMAPFLRDPVATSPASSWKHSIGHWSRALRVSTSSDVSVAHVDSPYGRGLPFHKNVLLLSKTWVPEEWLSSSAMWRVQTTGAPVQCLFARRVVSCSTMLEPCLLYDAGHPDQWVHCRWSVAPPPVLTPTQTPQHKVMPNTPTILEETTLQDASSTEDEDALHARAPEPTVATTASPHLGDGRSSTTTPPLTPSTIGAASLATASQTGLDSQKTDPEWPAETGVLPLVHTEALRRLKARPFPMYTVIEQLHHPRSYLFLLIRVTPQGECILTALADSVEIMCAYKYFGSVPV